MLKTVLAYLILTTTLIAGEFTSLIATELAIVTMRPGESVVEKVPRSKCPICHGSGKVKAGDTVTVVWRECDNCYEDSKPTGDLPSDSPSHVEMASAVLGVIEAVDEAAEPEHPEGYDTLVDAGKPRRVLMFTAKWCAPCLGVKGDLLPEHQTRTKTAPLTAMKNAGWSVGHENSDQFQLIDVDQHPQLMQRFSVSSLPTFVSWVNFQEAGRQTGGLSSGMTTRAFNDSLANLYGTEVPEQPGAILRLGRLEGARPKIDELRRVLSLLGSKGTIELRPDDPGQPIEIAVSATTSIRLSMPFKLRYEVQGDVISLIFETPPPVRYRFLRGSLTEVEITTGRINVKIKGLPDGFFDIQS